MRIAVLFDGAGLARLGLELAGHECTGFELDPVAHWLGRFVGSGRTMLGDATAKTTVDLRDFDAVWASPPCQVYSDARAGNSVATPYASDLLGWSLSLPERFPHLRAVWVENTPKGIVWNLSEADRPEAWGTLWNAAQFGPVPLQNRNRMIGGKYAPPVARTALAQDVPRSVPHGHRNGDQGRPVQVREHSTGRQVLRAAAHPGGMRFSYGVPGPRGVGRRTGRSRPARVGAV